MATITLSNLDEPVSRRPGSGAPDHAAGLGIALLVPYLLVFLAFVVYPVCYGLWLARHPASYVALYNDPIFARAAVNTLIFSGDRHQFQDAGGVVPVRLLRAEPGLDSLAFGAVHSAVAVPSIPTILSVRFMLNPEWGVVNQLIFKFTGEDGPNWLNEPAIALTMAILMHIWKSLPFWTLILMTGGSRSRRTCSRLRPSMVQDGGRSSASSLGRRCGRCISPARCSR